MFQLNAKARVNLYDYDSMIMIMIFLVFHKILTKIILSINNYMNMSIRIKLKLALANGYIPKSYTINQLTFFFTILVTIS